PTPFRSLVRHPRAHCRGARAHHPARGHERVRDQLAREGLADERDVHRRGALLRGRARARHPPGFLPRAYPLAAEGPGGLNCRGGRVEQPGPAQGLLPFRIGLQCKVPSAKESEMFKSLIAMAIAIASAVGLAACGTRAETIGTVGGAAAGGAVGSSVTGGSTLGTVGGAA